MDRIDGWLLYAALALYTIGWLLFAGGRIFIAPRSEKAGPRVLLAGFVAHTVSIAARWILTGHGPVMRDFENALAGAWVIAGISLFLARRREVFRPLHLVTIPVTLLLVGYGLTRPQELEALSPTLKTPWLYIHVTFAWISFGTFTAASSAAAIYLFRALRRRGEVDSLAALDELQFRLIAYGFVAAAVMIASGALWAKILWGTYWGWDPVETWSLASFIVYGLYIHLRLVFGWRGVRAAWLALLAVIPVIVSFWGVGLMMTSRHLFQAMDTIR